MLKIIFNLFICLQIIIFGASTDTIKIGVSAAMSGTSKDLGQSLVSGMNLVFDEINENGGINGKQIKLIIKDDQYNPDLTVKNTIELIKNDNVDLLMGFTGTPTVQKILPLLISHNRTLYFPFTGAQILVTPPYKDNVILLRPTYWDEIDAIINYFKEQGTTNVAIFYQLDGYGMNGVSRVRQKLEALEKTAAIEVNYIRGRSYDSSFEIEANLILNTNPDAVICISSYEASAGIIRDLRRAGWGGIIGNISFSDKESLETILKAEDSDLFSNLVHSQVLSEFNRYPAINEYMSKVGAYNSVEFEGFINAKAIAYLIKNSKNLVEINDTFYQIQEIDLGFEAKVLRKDNQILSDIYLLTTKDSQWVPEQ